MSTYAGRYDESLLKFAGGKLVPATSASVEVYESDGTTLATLYGDRLKGAGANPVSTDGDGNLEFFADPGIYVLKVYEDGTLVRTDTVSIGLDPSDTVSGVDMETVLDNLGGGMLVAGAGMGITYNDVANTITFAVTVPYTSGEQAKLAAIEAGATADQLAAEVPIADAGGIYVAANVEAALAEVKALADTNATNIAKSILLKEGAQVRAVYKTVAVSGVGSDGWYFPNVTASTIDFTGRVASVTWEGTASQIPAAGTSATSFRLGDSAVERPSTA